MRPSHDKPAPPKTGAIQRPHDSHNPNAEVDVDDAQIEEPKDDAFEGIEKDGGKKGSGKGERGKNGKA